MNSKSHTFPLKLMESFFDTLVDAAVIYKQDKMLYANKSAEQIFDTSLTEKSSTQLFGTLLAKEPFRAFGGVEINGKVRPVLSVASENDTHIIVIRLHDLAELERIDAKKTSENLRQCLSELRSESENLIKSIRKSHIDIKNDEYLFAYMVANTREIMNFMDNMAEIIYIPTKAENYEMIAFTDFFAYTFKYLSDYIENKEIKIEVNIDANASDVQFYGNQNRLHTLILDVTLCALRTIKDHGKLTAKLKRQSGNIAISIATNCNELDTKLLRICFGELSLYNEFNESRRYLGNFSQAFRIAKEYDGEIAVRCFETGGMDINILLPDRIDSDCNDNVTFEPSSIDILAYVGTFSEFLSIDSYRKNASIAIPKAEHPKTEQNSNDK